MRQLAKFYKLYRIVFIKKPRVNNQITAPELRVIGPKGENFGVLAKAEALSKAMEVNLDLIEISPTAQPPVAKIMDQKISLPTAEKTERRGQKTPRNRSKGSSNRTGHVFLFFLLL